MPLLSEATQILVDIILPVFVLEGKRGFGRLLLGLLKTPVILASYDREITDVGHIAIDGEFT